MALRARFAAICRVRARILAPPGAATLAESSAALDQSIRLASPRTCLTNRPARVRFRAYSARDHEEQEERCSDVVRSPTKRGRGWLRFFRKMASAEANGKITARS